MEGKDNPLRMCIETEQTGNNIVFWMLFPEKRKKKIDAVKFNITQKTTI